MDIGLTWMQALTVAVSAVGVYVGFLLLVRLVGARLLASSSIFDVAAAIGLGALMGRAILGYTPTVLAALLGMASLLVLHTGFSRARRNPRFEALVSPPPVLLLVDGRVLEDNLRRVRMREGDLHAKLRQAGVRRVDEVAAAVLERTGAISILRRGETIAPELVADVVGRELLRPQHIRPDSRP